VSPAAAAQSGFDRPEPGPAAMTRRRATMPVMPPHRSVGGPSPRRPSEWTVEYYVTASGSSPVLEWLRRLPEPKRAAWLAFVDFALVPMGKDIAQSGYVKPLGQGLFELRVDHDASELAQVFGADRSIRPELADLVAEGILLRVFCTFYGDKVVLLLSGLDKGADPKAQPRAIRAARKLLADWQAELAAAKRRSRRR
jgi:putative component of toxin-antitoxin plasmid stabilization module